jgi:membrane-bound ClpP family serine protease
MEQFGFAIIAIILIALGIAFVFAELESEEVEFFGPAAIFCFISGMIFWFMSNPTSWLGSPEWTEIITIIRKEGYIQFHGEYWKARSNMTIGPGQKVKIIKKEGLILFIEPEEDLFCPKCGTKLVFGSEFCSNCGTHIKN